MLSHEINAKWNLTVSFIRAMFASFICAQKRFHKHNMLFAILIIIIPRLTRCFPNECLFLFLLYIICGSKPRAQPEWPQLMTRARLYTQKCVQFLIGLLREFIKRNFFQLNWLERFNVWHDHLFYVQSLLFAPDWIWLELKPIGPEWLMKCLCAGKSHDQGEKPSIRSIS